MWKGARVGRVTTMSADWGLAKQQIVAIVGAARRPDSIRPVVSISWLGKSYQGPEGLPERGKGCGKRYINIPKCIAG